MPRCLSFSILPLAFVCFLYAGDEQHMALVAKAESAFDRVELTADPQLRDAAACIQAQAALIPVALPEELPVAHFRKGYCTLANAVIAGDSSEFTAAAGEFDKAMVTWPAHASAKNRPPEPISSGILVLGSIARLKSGLDQAGTDLARNAISAALAAPTCLATIIPPSSCDAVLRIGRQWLGWLALRAGDVNAAAIDLAGAAGSGWPEWVAGLQDFEHGRYRDAATEYRQAIGLLHPDVPTSLLQRLGPPADKPQELTELGGAQLLAGDPAGAITTLDAAVKGNAAASRAVYLRARARELSGHADAALADYSLASRLAFANARDLASGEAHLYRGIIYYRHKDYSHAEDEFASALNFTIEDGMRSDAVAWRHLSAVASGGCEASRQYLERSLGTVSPYFPKEEARMVLAGCQIRTAEDRSQR